ncbi:MAG: endonuclease/exonuclease/phosphatase family protein [Alistipes sp.]|nr:endonuclease/exonuclease/phosphatase family protein [Alistipes sp.]
MAEVYSSGFSRRNRRRESGNMGKKALMLLDLLTWIAMFLLTSATVVCTITPHIDPKSLSWLSLVVLATPIIYIINIVILLWWVIRNKWLNVVVASIAVIISLFSLGRYYQIEIKRKPAIPYIERRFVKTISYNVANGKAEGLIDYIAEKNPDILCLQEFLIDVNDEWLKLGDKYRSTINGATDFSCEIITRHRILRHGNIDSISRYNANWADIIIKKSEDTIRVVNLHLQSTTLHSIYTQSADKENLTGDSTRQSRIGNIAKRLRDNNIKRAEQARCVKRFIDASPYPVIVCGDFNDVPLSYTYDHIAQGLNDAFREQGAGYSHTFNGFFNLMRIDYTLVSERINVVSYEVDDKAPYSDHYPVICRLKIDKR